MTSKIKKYEQLSYNSKTEHSKTFNYYSKWNTRLNLLNISIVSMIGISNNITTISGMDNKVLSVSYSIILYFSVLLSASQQFLKYEELAEKHRIASIRYNHLYNLCLMSDEGDLASVIEEYENIYNSSPIIPEHLKINEETVHKTPDNIDLATTQQLNKLILQSFN